MYTLFYVIGSWKNEDLAKAYHQIARKGSASFIHLPFTPQEDVTVIGAYILNHLKASLNKGLIRIPYFLMGKVDHDSPQLIKTAEKTCALSFLTGIDGTFNQNGRFLLSDKWREKHQHYLTNQEHSISFFLEKGFQETIPQGPAYILRALNHLQARLEKLPDSFEDHFDYKGLVQNLIDGGYDVKRLTTSPVAAERQIGTIVLRILEKNKILEKS